MSKHCQGCTDVGLRLISTKVEIDGHIMRIMWLCEDCRHELLHGEGFVFHTLEESAT